MRRPSALVHVLVCLALFLNGISAAQASTRMLAAISGLAGEATAQQAREHSPSASPCHSLHASASTNLDLPMPDKGEAPADCCQSGDCACGCANHFQLALASTPLLFPAVMHSNRPAAITPARAAPALPHLIRPPIA